MKQIIELAQNELAAQENILMNLKQDKEYALNEALKRQSEIPVQEAKVNELTVALEGLYETYGHPDTDSGTAAVVPSPKSVKSNPYPSKKAASTVNKNDILRAVNQLSFSDYRAAFEALNKIVDDED